MDKKYELTEDTITCCGRTLHRVRAIKSFGGVKAGELGGYIENEDNLSQEGDAWVYGNAQVYDSARVYGDAWVYGDALVYGNAQVYGNADIQSSRNYFVAGPLGSRDRFTTFFRTKSNDIKVACGCFKGTIDEFVSKVKETHGTSAYGQEYCGIVDFVKNYLNLIKE